MAVSSLTEAERLALLPSVINLSDGHAHQSLGDASRDRVSDVFGSFITAAARPDYYAAEREFLDSLSQHTGQAYTAGQFFVTYASSVAMEMVATYLRRERRIVGVLCPTFDNIPGILAEAEVPTVPVPEKWVIPACDYERLESLGIGALLLVTPNNPTGACPAPAALQALLEWAARRRLTVILDLAFRWFEPNMAWDIIAQADACGADVITIDDTGKILSLADLKVGILSVSRGLRRRFQDIHDQIVLNVSELTLRLLTVMMEPARETNEIARAIRLIGRNRRYLGSQLEACGRAAGGTLLSPAAWQMSVQWLRLPGDQARLVRDCRAQGLEILSGRNFYWSQHGEGAQYVRLALLRDHSYFAAGAGILARALGDSLMLAS